MVELIYQKHYRGVKRLPFCYLCGKRIDYTTEAKALRDEDHVPPKSLFARADREPLILSTHKKCNGEHSAVDQRMGEVIGLKLGRIPKSHKDSVLRIRLFDGGRHAAVVGLDIQSAVWRWIHGFHAALYREMLVPMVPNGGVVVTPFQRTKDSLHMQQPDPVPPSATRFVEVIKANRAKSNLDRIITNNRKMTYECVWLNLDDGTWICIFALDIYAWRDMGDPSFGHRGCVGAYRTAAGVAPANATLAVAETTGIPSADPLDPFGL
jgi:hypothetical protein